MSSRISANHVHYATIADDSPIVQYPYEETELDLLLSTDPHQVVNTSPHLFPATPENMPQTTLNQGQPSVAASNDNDEVCNISPRPIETEVDGLASYVF